MGPAAQGKPSAPQQARLREPVGEPACSGQFCPYAPIMPWIEWETHTTNACPDILKG